MDEARRFLRYVTPGLTFAVQALLLLFIVNPPWTLDRIGELKKGAGAGLAFALFLASGALATYSALFTTRYTTRDTTVSDIGFCVGCS
jgi:hypothetical protein